MRKSPDGGVTKQETSISADPDSLDVENSTFSDGNSNTSSEDHFAQVPYIDESFVHSSNAATRILTSNLSESYSYNGWDEIEKQSNGTSEDLCREVRCVETEESSTKGAKEPDFLQEHVNVEEQTMKSPSTPSEKDQFFMSPPSRNEAEVIEYSGSAIIPSTDNEELTPAPLMEDKDSFPTLYNKEREFSSSHFRDIPSLENLSSRRELDFSSSVTRRLRLTKSRSCKASIADSASPFLKMIDFSSSFGSERESESVAFERKLSPSSFSPNLHSLSRKDSHSSPGNALDIEIDTPNVKFATADDGAVISTSTDVTEKIELPIEHIYIKNPVSCVFSLLCLLNFGIKATYYTIYLMILQSKETELNENESPKKNVKDVGLDPMEDEVKDLSSWPLEFQRLQREIIELWHSCNVSLVHRSYFFMLFQGDPSDAIYLEVEMRRMKFLKDKFSHGDMTIVNGRCLTLASR